MTVEIVPGAEGGFFGGKRLRKPDRVYYTCPVHGGQKGSAVMNTGKRRRFTDAEYAEMAADYEAEPPRADEVISIEIYPNGDAPIEPPIGW
jgi:hypothetical protein